jgi:Leucine-rich repeat (LRR) protein
MLRGLTLHDNILIGIPESLSSLTLLGLLTLQGNRISPTTSGLESFPPILGSPGGLKGGFGGSLNHLDLSNNELCQLPVAVPNLRQLKSFKASECVLKELPPVFFSLLTSMEDLDLSCNQLQCLGPVGATLPASLKTLKIRSNAISALPQIAHLSLLTELNASSNLLTAMPSPLPSALLQLNLSGNSLTSAPIDGAPLLTSLDLSHNDLDCLPAALLSLSRLESLSVSSNHLSELLPVPDPLPTPAPALRALRRLDAARNDIAHLPPALPALLPAIELLELYGNSLAAVPASLARCGGLTWLGLGRNRLETLPPQLAQLSALTALSVAANPVALRLADLSPAVLRLVTDPPPEPARPAGPVNPARTRSAGRAAAAPTDAATGRPGGGGGGGGGGGRAASPLGAAEAVSSAVRQVDAMLAEAARRSRPAEPGPTEGSADAVRAEARREVLRMRREHEQAAAAKTAAAAVAAAAVAAGEQRRRAGEDSLLDIFSVAAKRCGGPCVRMSASRAVAA